MENSCQNKCLTLNTAVLFLIFKKCDCKIKSILVLKKNL